MGTAVPEKRPLGIRLKKETAVNCKDKKIIYSIFSDRNNF